MKKVDGAQANATLLAILYAQAKCLKTTTYLGAPKEWRPMCVLDTDRGAQLRLQVLAMTHEERMNLGIMEPISEYFGPWIKEDITFFYPDPNNWYNDCWEFATKIAPNYKLAVCDTLTHMAVKSLNEVKGLQYQGVSKETKRVHLKTGNVTTVHPTMSDYGFSQDRVMEFVTALDESSAHVLLVSHEKTGEVKDTENRTRIIGGPRTIGNALLELLPSIVDVVVRLEVQGVGANTKLVTRTRNHNFFICGDRSGLFKDGETHDVERFWKKLSSVLTLASTNA